MAPGCAVPQSGMAIPPGDGKVLTNGITHHARICRGTAGPNSRTVITPFLPATGEPVLTWAFSRPRRPGPAPRGSAEGQRGGLWSRLAGRRARRGPDHDRDRA